MAHRYVLIAALLLLTRGAVGKTTVTAEVGWGERVRPGRWTPITLRMTDSDVRAAEVEVYAPQTGSYGMRVWQHVTLGPAPTTVQLYAPLHPGGWEGPAVTIRDARTHKELAHYPSEAVAPTPYYNTMVDAGSRFVGVSGGRTQLQSLGGQVGDLKLTAGYLEPRLLPRAPIGYDGLDLLVLNRPDLSAITPEQQTAILDWVRGGGSLLLWPGDDPLPADAPLTRALPCRVEGIRDYVLSPEDRERLAPSGRAAGIRGRELVADAAAGGAEEIELFETSPGAAFARRHGLGRIVVVPFDLSQLPFPNAAAAGAVWVPAIRGMGLLPAESGAKPNDSNYYYGADPDLRRELAATGGVQERLGDIPGLGQFGFSYVALVLIGMMVVVGPVDWFVLKKLGRQPWTWVTTSGWIALVTLGAVYAGHALKSGALHYRSATVVDQIDGATVGETSLGLVYSPRTAEYHLDAADSPPGPAADPPAGWWSPASAEQYSRGGLVNDISFHQARGGNPIDPMVINVWNMRVLRGETAAAGTPYLDADLTWQAGADGKPWRITGTVKNLTDRPLANLRLATRFGWAGGGSDPGEVASVVVAQLGPGATAAIDVPCPPRVAAETSGNGHSLYGAQTQELWAATLNLSGRRAARADGLVSGGRWAAVSAECPDPVPPAVLRETGAKERHFKIVRAVVPVAGEPPLAPAGVAPPAGAAN